MSKSLAKRDAKGRILPGSPGISPGRPPRARELAYLNVMIRTCTLDDWQEITAKAMEQAKSGNKDARKWLTDYIIGPAATIVQAIISQGSDTLQLDERATRLLAILEGAKGAVQGESITIASSTDDT